MIWTDSKGYLTRSQLPWFNGGMANIDPTLKLRPYRYGEATTGKIDRYYVDIDDVTVGWVLKNDDGWAMFATVYDWAKATLLTSGNSTRRDALMEGVSELGIRHLGRVVRLNTETFKEETVAVDTDALKALWERLLDEKYPGVA